MALESCKPGDKKNSLLANYQQSFRIDDLLRQKAIEQQPDHFSLPPPTDRFDDAPGAFRIGPVPPLKPVKAEVQYLAYHKSGNVIM